MRARRIVSRRPFPSSNCGGEPSRRKLRELKNQLVGIRKPNFDGKVFKPMALCLF